MYTLYLVYLHLALATVVTLDLATRSTEYLLPVFETSYRRLFCSFSSRLPLTAAALVPVGT